MEFTDYDLAKSFLIDMLGDYRVVRIGEIFRKGAVRGISKKTLKEVRKEMVIVSCSVSENGEYTDQVWFMVPPREG
jgi:hypothetical protein